MWCQRVDRYHQPPHGSPGTLNNTVKPLGSRGQSWVSALPSHNQILALAGSHSAWVFFVRVVTEWSSCSQKQRLVQMEKVHKVTPAVLSTHQPINYWSWIRTSHLKKAMSLPCFLRTGFVGAWVEGLRVWWVAEAAAAAPAGWVRAGGSVSVWGWIVCGTCT